MRRAAREEEGQAIFLVALVLLTLLFAIGLAIDTGQLFNGKRTAQEAADAAAFGGAVAIYQNGTDAQARSAAIADAALNGYATGSPAGTTVTVNVPPLSGPHSGQTGYVEVVIETQVHTTIVPAQAALTMVRVRAVGGSLTLGSLYAVMAIGQTGNNTFTASGGSTLQSVGGGVLVNSTANGAAAVSGGAIVSSDGPIDIVGGYSGAGWTPTPTTGADVMPDPLAGYPKPSTVGATQQTCCAATLNPGVYSGGITIVSGASVTMNPGMYILKGGGFNLAGTASVTGHGVTIFNTNTGYPAINGPCGAINFSGGSFWDLSAPVTGTYQGMLVFQDSNCANSITLAGSSGGVSSVGTIYAPTAQVNLSGGTSFSINSQIVSKHVSVSGGATFTVNYDPGQNASLPIPSLVE